MKRALCGQCSSGWVPETPKTFDPTCRGCKQKLADGLRTGKEPLPSNRGGWAVKKLQTGLKQRRLGKLRTVR